MTFKDLMVEVLNSVVLKVKEDIEESNLMMLAFESWEAQKCFDKLLKEFPDEPKATLDQELAGYSIKYR